MTTLVDAFVKPHMGRYLERIRDELGPGLREKPFLVMQSSGGVASPDQVMRKPITTALSGPAAGALGSAVIAEIAGFPDVVTLDAGGTSTDLCLIESAKPHVTNGGAVGPFPVRIPMIDIETIGTGGGSIAWISREGHLKVGPRSAGAEPGPMCYPNGGSEPTITDANLVLGPDPAGADRRRHSPRCANARARASRELAARLPGNMSVGAARRRHHRDRQLEPGECHPADDHPARHRSARIRAALVRRLRPGAIAGGDGADRHEGLHRAAQSRQSLRLRTAGRRLAHRSHRDQGHARGRHRPCDCRGHLCRVSKPTPPRRWSATASSARASGSCAKPTCAMPGSRWKCACRRPRARSTRAFIDGLVDCVPRRASQDFRLQLCRPAESGAGQFLRVRFRHDRSAEHSRSSTSARTRRRSATAGRCFSPAPSATRRSIERASLPAGFRLDGPAVIEEFGSTTVVFPGQRLEVDAHGILIVRPARRAPEAVR